MATRDDKLLAALRSLSPPKGGSGVPPEDPPGPPRSAQEEDDGGGSGKRRRTFELSVEEVGVFFLAAAMLLVLAFLMGWYGRGVAMPGSRSGEKSSGPGRPTGMPSLRVDEGSAQDLGETPSGVRPGSPSGVVYTILAARFPGSGAGEAADHMARLRELGFVPTFLRPTRDEKGRSLTELCVGRFASQTDPVLQRWLKQIRQLGGAFAKAVIARIPDTRIPRVGPGTGSAPRGELASCAAGGRAGPSAAPALD